MSIANFGTGAAAAPTALGVGLIGGGFMGAVHSRAARAAGARLVGIASSGPAAAQRAAAAYGIERAFDTAEQLIADDAVEVVHVLTPNTTHLPLALAALEAGKHVVCEKPLATSTADARRLLDAATAAGVVHTVPFAYRFHPMAREARARIAAGDVGRLLTVRGAYLQDWLVSATDDNWRVDDALGGPSRAFADIGSHLVDLLEFVTGDRITRLLAQTRTAVASRATHGEVRTEDLAAVLLETAGGAVGTLLVSQVAPGRKNALTLEVHGSAESIAFDQENPDTLWVGRQSRSEIVPRDTPTLAPDAARLSIVPAGHPLGYQDAFTAFAADTYAAVAGARPEGLPTFADGLRAVTVTDAVLASAASGTWADL